MTVLYISLSSAILDLLVGKRSATSCQLSVKNKEKTEKVYIATFKTEALSRPREKEFYGFPDVRWLGW
jgi:hypothetical protein